MPLLRVHFFIVQISSRLDQASFKNPSYNFAEWGVKAVSKQDTTYRESIFCSHSSFLREEDWREFRRLPGAWSTSTFRFDRCTTRALRSRILCRVAVVFASCSRSSLQRDATQKPSTSFLSRFLSATSQGHFRDLQWRWTPGWLLTGRGALSRSRIHADYAS